MELSSFQFERNGIEGRISYTTGEGLVLHARRVATGAVNARQITEAEAEAIVAQVRGGNGRTTFDRWEGAESLKAACLADLHKEAEQLHHDDPLAQNAHLLGLLDECGCSIAKLAAR